MVTDIRQILADAFENLRYRISSNIDTAGKVASGKTQESLKVEIVADADGWSATLFGRPFFGALETGSRPWRNQYPHPPRFFQDIMKQWIDDKGLDLNPYLVARKIMREGSALYRAGGRSDIYSEEIPATINELKIALGRVMATPIVQAHIKLNQQTNEL